MAQRARRPRNGDKYKEIRAAADEEAIQEGGEKCPAGGEAEKSDRTGRFPRRLII